MRAGCFPEMQMSHRAAECSTSNLEHGRLSARPFGSQWSRDCLRENHVSIARYPSGRQSSCLRNYHEKTVKKHHHHQTSCLHCRFVPYDNSLWYDHSPLVDGAITKSHSQLLIFQDYSQSPRRSNKQLAKGVALVLG